MSNGFVLHIHYNNAPPMTSNSNFNVCVLVGNVNSILPYILQIELEYFGPFVTSYNGSVRFVRLKTLASNYGYQEKLHEDYEKKAFMWWSHPNVRRHYVQTKNIYFYVPRA